MLPAISWSDYLQSILYLFLLYYAGILTLYFRKDIYWYIMRYQHGIGRRYVHNRKDGIAVPAENPQENHGLFTSAETLLSALKKLFRNAAQQHFQKEELVMALQLELRDFMELQGTAFEVAINNHITQQANIECAIMLEETDINNLWQSKSLFSPDSTRR